MLFSARELRTVLVVFPTVFGVKSALQRSELFGKLTFADRIRYLFVGRAEVHSDIVTNRKRKQCKVLKDRRYHIGVPVMIDLIDIRSVDQYFSRGRTIQLAKQLYQRGFSGTVVAHYRQAFSFVNRQTHILESIAVTAAILEPDMIKHDLMHGSRIYGTLVLSRVKRYGKRLNIPKCTDIF